MFTIPRHTGIFFVSALLGVTLMVTTALPMPVPRTTITVSGTPWGMSPCDIGATEGHVRVAVADLQCAPADRLAAWHTLANRHRASRWPWGG